MTTKIIATLPTDYIGNGKWLDKEIVQTAYLVGVCNGKPVELAKVVWFMSRTGDGASPQYCTVRVASSNWPEAGGLTSFVGCAGHGKATGYGYHKGSAALERALYSAGIKLSADIDGRGDSAVRDALVAIGVALGYAESALLVL